ncbi:MAG: hypothetical protein CHKLHMKO_00131 [Candidatus Argoarchaeum ethanivorans]|uniref:Tubulin/FtsZ GTPase domain-containing protein n=1 Tax=Candidatus Argoarchaeum ethanivorans TaxID=2608793 RepID=A0A811T725_9EURY|nr:MAG: hypothetical protein CHKLHMKO_00131 [Candidatus Argoarchaeum ethanivorans]
MIGFLGLGSSGFNIADEIWVATEGEYEGLAADYDPQKPRKIYFINVGYRMIPVARHFVSGEYIMECNFNEEGWDKDSCNDIRRFFSTAWDCGFIIKGGGGGSGAGMYRAIMSNIDIGANFVPCIVGPFKHEAIEVFINTAAWFGTLKDSNFTTGLYIDNSHVEKKIGRPFIAGEDRIRNLVNRRIARYFKVIIEAYDKSSGFGKLPAAINLISEEYITKKNRLAF